MKEAQNMAIPNEASPFFNICIILISPFKFQILGGVEGEVSCNAKWMLLIQRNDATKELLQLWRGEPTTADLVVEMGELRREEERGDWREEADRRIESIRKGEVLSISFRPFHSEI